MKKTNTIEWIKEQRQEQIEASVVAFASTGKKEHLEDIEAINEHYDEILQNMYLSKIYHSRNYA